MLWQPMNPDPLASSAASAFAVGDWRTARETLQELAAGGKADAEAFAMLAAACLHLNDAAAAHGAADRALALNGRNLRAVLVKAELLTAESEQRGANHYNG